MFGDHHNNTITTTRRSSRQSLARIRKSISKDKNATTSSMLTGNKRVTWCPTTTDSEANNVIEVSNHYDGIPKELIWYTRDELPMIRISNEITIAEYQQQQNQQEQDEQDVNDSSADTTTTMRGLESSTEEGYWYRYQQYRDCINKVLDEQDRQMGIDETEFHYFGPSPLIKRVNHLHIPFDHERLASLSRDVTSKSRRTAAIRGKSDYLEAMKIQQEQEEEQEQQKPTTGQAAAAAAAEKVKDNDDTNEEEETMTVQTEASTIMISSVDGDEDDSSETTKEEEDNNHDATNVDVDVPTEISHPDTPESLAEKQRLRYEKYLVNRQSRILAKEQAEYQWEQRRMERRESIRQETKDFFNRFEQLQKQRVDLMAAMMMMKGQ